MCSNSTCMVEMQYTGHYCAFLPNAVFRGGLVTAWNWPRWTIYFTALLTFSLGCDLLFCVLDLRKWWRILQIQLTVSPICSITAQRNRGNSLLILKKKKPYLTQQKNNLPLTSKWYLMLPLIWNKISSSLHTGNILVCQLHPQVFL